MLVWIARGALALAAILATLVTRRAPAHRPLALSLGAFLLVDLARVGADIPAHFAEAAKLTRRLAYTADLAAVLGALAATVWGALRAFRIDRPGRWVAGAWGTVVAGLVVAVVATTESTRPWWPWVYPAAHGIALAAELAAYARFYATRGLSTITQRVAIAITFGDLAALISVGIVGGWDSTFAGPSLVVWGCACALQTHWLLVTAPRLRLGA